MTDYVALTEISGDDVTVEQVERIARRYYWAAKYCAGKDVLEAGCGTGQGLGLLASVAKSLQAGDYSEPILAIAREHYGERIALKHFDAQSMPFEDASLDVVILFEALYYVPDAPRFFSESKRILRNGGHLLIATANKDLFDFNPSPHSYKYYGVTEFESELGALGFSVECFGDTPVGSVSAKQRILRPVKLIASRLGLIPRSMKAKKFFKRLVFGNLVPMPAEINDTTADKIPPILLSRDKEDTNHKVILCAARKQ